MAETLTRHRNFEKMFLLIYFERERETERESRGGADRERGSERIPSRLCTDSTEPDMGLEPMKSEIVT